mgnify:CR=1 FL=1
MELKHVSHSLWHTSAILLIVPYGIETPVARIRSKTGNRLLIVPYGIETYPAIRFMIESAVF